MLVNYSTSTRKYIINAGGVDGSYGNGTCNGVKAFQGAVGLDIDGACGKKYMDQIQIHITFYRYNKQL